MQLCETCFNILLVEEESEKFDEKKAKKKIFTCDFTGCSEFFSTESELKNHNEGIFNFLIFFNYFFKKIKN